MEPMVQEPPASIVTYEAEKQWVEPDLDFGYIDQAAFDIAETMLGVYPAEVAYQPGDGTFYGLVFCPLPLLRAARPRVGGNGLEWDRFAVRGMLVAGRHDPFGVLVSWLEHGCYPLRFGNHREGVAADYVAEHFKTSPVSATSLAILFRAVSYHLDELRAQ